MTIRWGRFAFCVVLTAIAYNWYGLGGAVLVALAGTDWR